MKQSRRNFIRDTSLWLAAQAPLVSGLSMLTQQAFAASLVEDADFNFVLFRVYGGMDSTLGVHPHLDTNSGLDQEDLFLTYQNHEILRNVAGTQISLGASARSLEPFAKKMAVLRGIYMGATEVGHPGPFQHISAARSQESAPHMTAQIGSKYSNAETFVTTNSNISRGSVVQPFPILLTQAMKSLGSVAAFGTKSGLDIYNDPTLTIQSYLDLAKRKDKLEKYMDIIKTQQKSEKLQDETVALANLGSGLSRVAQIDMVDLSTDIDTHGNHENHKGFQQLRWERIAAFLQGLVELNIFDKTLVAVVTEFNRSPGRNKANGKDHNLTDNSVALFGRNIQGGRVFGDRKLYLRSGDSPSRWAGNFLNFKTGKVAESDAIQALQNPNLEKALLPQGVKLIHPRDLWASVSNSLSPELLRHLAADSSIIPGLFKGT